MAKVGLKKNKELRNLQILRGSVENFVWTPLTCKQKQSVLTWLHLWEGVSNLTIFLKSLILNPVSGPICLGMFALAPDCMPPCSRREMTSDLIPAHLSYVQRHTGFLQWKIYGEGVRGYLAVGRSSYSRGRLHCVSVSLLHCTSNYVVS